MYIIIQCTYNCIIRLWVMVWRTNFQIHMKYENYKVICFFQQCYEVHTCIHTYSICRLAPVVYVQKTCVKVLMCIHLFQCSFSTLERKVKLLHTSIFTKIFFCSSEHSLEFRTCVCGYHKLSHFRKQLLKCGYVQVKSFITFFFLYVRTYIVYPNTHTSYVQCMCTQCIYVG